jgi:hypothetical protein
MPNIAPEIWERWINILEDILHDADVGRANEFAIHIDSAILAAHQATGTERAVPQHDQLSGKERQS